MGRTMMLCCRSALTPLFLVVVLFGLHQSHGEEQTAHRLRRRSLVEGETEAQPRNTYWDLPETSKLYNKSPTLNPYWQLDNDETDGVSDTFPADVYHAATAEEDTDTEAAEKPNEAGSIEVSSSNNVYHAFHPEEKHSSSTLQAGVVELQAEVVDLQAEVTVVDHNENLRASVFDEQCLSLLENHAENDQLNRQQYVNFLHSISNDTLDSQDFTSLPLFLAMIFFSASCSSGEDCVTQEPVISIHPLGSPENQMNQVLCNQLMRFPFMEILLPFQFLVRVNNGLSAAELLSYSEEEVTGEEPDMDPRRMLVPNLEGALDQVLLKGFNCSDVPREPIRHKKKIPPRERSQYRQPQPQHECDFVVDVSVEDAADYPCGFQSSCILIFSDVIVYAVLKESLDEPTLRKMTTDVLRDAINGNALNEFL